MLKACIALKNNNTQVWTGGVGLCTTVNAYKPCETASYERNFPLIPLSNISMRVGCRGEWCKELFTEAQWTQEFTPQIYGVVEAGADTENGAYVLAQINLFTSPKAVTNPFSSATKAVDSPLSPMNDQNMNQGMPHNMH